MSKEKEIYVTKRNGTKEKFNAEKINTCAIRACDGIAGVSPSELCIDANLQIFDGIKSSDIDKALLNCARDKIYKEPNYS